MTKKSRNRRVAIRWAEKELKKMKPELDKIAKESFINMIHGKQRI